MQLVVKAFIRKASIVNPLLRLVVGFGVPNQLSANNVFTKYFFLNQNATFTNAIITGTSTNGPITAAKASPELIPKTAMATAMASSKLLLAAVNDKVVDCS